MGRSGETREEAGLTHRQRQALQTRRLIAEAATRLFLERGYAATTIDAIAGEAGVAVSTVYAVFKNKRAVLREIRMAWHQQTRAREINEEAAEQQDPERRLEMVAHANRRQWELGAKLVAIYQGAAAADREAAAELEEALRGRRAALDRVVKGMEAALRPGMSVDRAAAILRALCRAEVYRELVEESGWSPDEYEAWLGEALEGQLLSPNADS
ncbi:MAG: TetR/AcrR family transcriptional regulator [Rubrobacteraceae bacterium]|nr:TetR/AcrR family transcriptional regulator [Rubrobacteraceae bacterium]